MTNTKLWFAILLLIVVGVVAIGKWRLALRAEERRTEKALLTIPIGTSVVDVFSRAGYPDWDSPQRPEDLGIRSGRTPCQNLDVVKSLVYDLRTREDVIIGIGRDGKVLCKARISIVRAH